MKRITPMSIRTKLAALFVLAAATQASSASADLKGDVAKARAKDPNAFIAVHEAVAHASAIDHKSRARKAPVALYLRGMGPKALLPLLEMIAFESSTPKSLRRDLIEAVGLMRDARALPVLVPILDEKGDDATTRAASEAIARLGTDEAATKLTSALTRSKGTQTDAILAGMGECRRPVIATTLADRSRTTKDEATARTLARSLGRVGNAWAWRVTADKSAEVEVRETAARALVGLFVRFTGEAREAASNALMVVDDPHTPALISEARRAADGETAHALDGLAGRFAKNPAR